MFKKKILILVPLLLSQAYTLKSYAITNEDVDLVNRFIEMDCLSPKVDSEQVKVEAHASGNVSVGFKLTGKASGDAKVDFSKSEWKGLQQVKENQRVENYNNFRSCSTYVTALILNKIENERDKVAVANKNEKDSKYNDVKLPLKVVGGTGNVYFSPKLHFEEGGSFQAGDKPGEIEITTPDKIVFKLTENENVNIVLDGKMFIIKFHFNKDFKPIYVLSKA